MVLAAPLVVEQAVYLAVVMVVVVLLLLFYYFFSAVVAVAHHYLVAAMVVQTIVVIHANAQESVLVAVIADASNKNNIGANKNNLREFLGTLFFNIYLKL